MLLGLITVTIPASLPTAPPALAEDGILLPTALEIDADQSLASSIEGKPVKLQVVSGIVDRLTMSADSGAEYGIRPTAIVGSANVNFSERREIAGKNHPLGNTIVGPKVNGRAF